MDTTHLVSYLPFDASPTADLCGNSWTTYGNPTVGTSGALSGNALQLDGSSYIQHNGSITLGGKDFTISGRVNMNSSAPNYSMMFEATTSKGSNYRIEISRYGTANQFVIWANELWGISPNFAVPTNQAFHLELDYQHSASSLKIFVDGVLVSTVNKTLAAKTFAALTVGANTRGSNKWLGSVDEFQIYDGVTLHTANFTPPTAEDYANISVPCTVTCDLQRTVKNAALTWRYENAGDADDLILTAPILTDLPATKSKFGVAFYQTTRAKCFDLPATSEVYIKFDVYFDGSNRWRAYNDKDGAICGVCSYVNYSGGDFGMWQNNNRVQDWLGICKTNTLQTVLLHMISGASDGIIEAWVDGNFIHSYTGNVNQGSDFADIYLQSDGSGTFFSNVIISNAPIGLDEDVQLGDIVTVDIQRRLANVVTTTADLQRRVIKSVEVFADIQRTILEPSRIFLKPEVFMSWIPRGDILIKPEIYASILTPDIPVTLLVDLQRRLSNVVAVTADTQRRVFRSESLTVDVQRRVFKTERVRFDIQRRITNNVVVTFDLQRRLANVETVTFDLQRKIIGNAIIKFDLQRRIITPEVVARMLSRISPIYDDSAFMQSFFQAIGVEWTKIRNYFLTLREQRFIKTVDWGIEYLEHKYSIVPDRTLTLEERRARLGIKALTKYPLNPAILEKHARDNYGLDVYLDESFAGYIFVIATELSKKGYEGFLKFLLREKPAHLALAFMLYSPEYIGGKDGDFPKLHAGLVEIDSGSESISLPKPRNQRLDLYAGAMQISHGTAKIGLPKPKSHLVKIWAGGVVLVSGTISIG